ncbi:hypothetical protein LCGC14_2115290 [marine sediment metagenome]|uniref:Sulfatase-modifying factor enzyme-like domain-containing protein n=1 Tax=marine sediment metagenome TaxID=412755 RepID=A0A0F9E5Z0_9ZZZZ
MTGRHLANATKLCLASVLAWSVLAAQEPSKPGGALPTTRCRSGAVMIRIPAGEFRMGSLDGQIDEKPVHKIRVDAFYMDKYLVTQGEYQRLMGVNPSRRKNKATNPVDQVTWAQGAAYCNARSREEGLEPCYDRATWRCDFAKSGYRLPTEAEWEYACRAGTRTVWFFGTRGEMLQVYAWHKANSGKRPRPVGRKSPNPWGLYDMVGNVWQWCNDYYAADYYKVSPGSNPTGPKGGHFKVARGGSWNSKADDCRSATRSKESPAFVRACFGRDEYGLRCVRRAPPGATSRPAPGASPGQPSS